MDDDRTPGSIAPEVGPSIHVGPAGWSYDDWEGIVYPRGLGAERLTAVARLFGTIEINSTFYRSPSPASASSWAAKMGDRPGFRFTAKLVRLFTHEHPRHWTLSGRDDYRDGLEPLREAGLLGPLLVQFPWYYDARDDNVHRLSRIRKAFPEHQLVLEVRHRDWLDRLDEVSSLGYSFCNADLPASSTSIPLDALVTGPIGYLRLHGQNRDRWFDRAAKVHEKYDYLYEEGEVERLVSVAERLRERSEQTYVVANNHFEGKAVANGLEIQKMLTGEVPPQLPPGLLERYPRLAGLCQEGPT